MTDKIKSTLIIGIAIILTGFLLGKSFKNRNANLDSISVIGLGTKDFISDEILWSGSFTANSMDIKTAYGKIISDQKIVADFFIKKGFQANEFSFGAINFQKKLTYFLKRIKNILALLGIKIYSAQIDSRIARKRNSNRLGWLWNRLFYLV